MHEHCEICVVPSLCKFYMRYSGNSWCHLIQCPFGCGVKLHHCKVADHEFVCGYALVSCPNAEVGGCSVRITRNRVSAHLKICRAYVIRCTFMWNRQIQANEAGNCPTENVPSVPLDFAFALSDQQAHTNEINTYSTSKTQNIENLGPAGSTNEVVSLNVKNCCSQRIQCSLCHVSHFNAEDSADLTFDCPPIAVDCVTKSAIDLPNLNVCQQNPIYIKYGLHCLSLYPKSFVDDSVLPWQTKTKTNEATFCCDKLLQYSEFAEHYKSVHWEIEDSLDNWILIRCPLFYMGCEFHTFRWMLNDDANEIVFDQNQKSFGLAVKTTPEPAVFDFSLLPFHVLCHVASFLDPFTLNSLSLVNRTFRHVAESQLTKNGIVERVWIKYINSEGNVKWKLANKKWRFSVAFKGATKWRLKNDVICEHLKCCPFNVVEQKDTPWKLPFQC